MVKTYIINIRLKSETCFDSNSSVEGFEEGKIYRDIEGYPYLPAKHFLGVLKSQVNDWLKPSSDADETKKIEEILEGSSDKINAKWSDFKVDKKIYDELQKFRDVDRDDFSIDIKPSELLVETRSTIKTKNIKNTYLNSMEIIPEGVEFSGIVTIDGYDAEEENSVYETLKKCIKLVSNIGIKKNRGFGKVELDIEEMIKNPTTNINSISDKSNWILYRLDVESPLKLTAENGSENYKVSTTYIPSSTMRGACIGCLMKNEKLRDDEIAEFIKTSCFYNAYPMFQEHYSIPTPNMYRVNKSDLETLSKNGDESKYFISDAKIRNNSGKSEMFYAIFDQLNGASKIGYAETVNYKPGEYCYYEDDTIHGFDAIKEVHSRSKILDNELYQYEVIAANQSYYGIVKVEELSKKNRNKFIEIFKSKLRLEVGSHRNLGYGQIKITEVMGFETIEDLNMKIGIESEIDTARLKNQFYLYSDLCADVEKLNDSYITDDREIKIAYNTKWQSMIPSVEVYRKGAIIETSDELEDILIKTNNCEGYNYLIKNPEFLKAKALKTEKVALNNTLIERVKYGELNPEFLQKIRWNYLKLYTDKKIDKYIEVMKIELKIEDLENLSYAAYFNLYEIYEVLKERVFGIKWQVKLDTMEKRKNLIREDLRDELGNNYIIGNLNLYDLLKTSDINKNAADITIVKFNNDIKESAAKLKKVILNGNSNESDLDFYIENKLLYVILDKFFSDIKRKA